MKQLDKGSVLKQLLWPMSVLILALFLSMTAYAGTATADETTTDDGDTDVITSYSIHYTKLYDCVCGKRLGQGERLGQGLEGGSA